jgi:hypothetical protein
MPVAGCAMHTHTVFGENLSMAVAAVHWIEAAPVPARIRADMTVEAFRHTMNRLRVLRRVYFMAVVTGIFLLGIRRLYRDWHAGEEEGEA